MSKPTVAIVGRPNVGKSTLFNRIIGGRRAIVSEQPGTTRDRHFGEAEWSGRRFWLVDTGGLVPDSAEAMDRAIARQVAFALDEADVIVFVTNGRDGVHPMDEAVADRLRKSGRPVVLAVNKLDTLERATEQYDFYRLGFGEPYGISAASGKGTGDLLEALVRLLPPRTDAEAEDTIGVAVVGRPNVGKSSLVNRLLGEERHVVSPVAGTTRDAVDSLLRYHGRAITFIDTAGLRKRSKVADDLEFYSTLRTERAVERADVCVLVVDAALGLHTQDLRIATAAWERGTALIVAVNKWDLIEEKDAQTAQRGEMTVTERAPFLNFVPFLYVSAATGQRVHQLLDLICAVADEREKRVQTAEVNKVLEQLVQRNSPPQRPGEEVKLLYASQVGTSPPTIAIVTNRPDDVPEAYQRYLVNGFRDAWDFRGSPLRLKFTARGSKRRCSGSCSRYWRRTCLAPYLPASWPGNSSAGSTCGSTAAATWAPPTCIVPWAPGTRYQWAFSTWPRVPCRSCSSRRWHPAPGTSRYSAESSRWRGMCSRCSCVSAAGRVSPRHRA
jgi:GTP-binding protein